MGKKYFFLSFFLLQSWFAHSESSITYYPTPGYSYDAATGYTIIENDGSSVTADQYRESSPPVIIQREIIYYPVPVPVRPPHSHQRWSAETKDGRQINGPQKGLFYGDGPVFTPSDKPKNKTNK